MSNLQLNVSLLDKIGQVFIRLFVMYQWTFFYNVFKSIEKEALDMWPHLTLSVTGWYITMAGMILGMLPADGRRRYVVTSSLIGCAHTQNDHSMGLVNTSLPAHYTHYWSHYNMSHDRNATLAWEIFCNSTHLPQKVNNTDCMHCEHDQDYMI